MSITSFIVASWVLLLKMRHNALCVMHFSSKKLNEFQHRTTSKKLKNRKTIYLFLFIPEWNRYKNIYYRDGIGIKKKGR